MGFFDQIWTGATDIAGGAAGFITDVADAGVELAGDPTNLGGAAEILYTSVQEDLMGRVLGGAFGPEGIIGTGIEALPDFIREPGAAVLMPTMEAWQWTIDEVVDRPLGTIATVLNATGANGIHELFDLDTYTAAYRINDGRTFGQSVAAAAYMINPFDEDEYNEIRDNPLFNVISGTADFIQEFIDPIELATGGAVGLARGSLVTASRGRRGTRILTPSRVLGGGTGIRPMRFKSAAQKSARNDILADFTTARIDHFIETPRWKTAQREMDAATTTAGQYEALNRMLGRGGAKMPEQAKVAVANGRTAEARNLTLRALSGDMSVHAQVQTVGTAFKAEWLDDSARMERATEYNVLLRELTEDADRVRVAGEEAGQARLAADDDVIHPFPETRGGGQQYHGSGNEPLEGLSDAERKATDNAQYGQGLYTTDALEMADVYAARSSRGTKGTTPGVAEPAIDASTGGKIHEINSTRLGDEGLFNIEENPFPAEIMDNLSPEVHEALVAGGVKLKYSKPGEPLSGARILDGINRGAPKLGWSSEKRVGVIDSIIESLKAKGVRGFEYTSQKTHKLYQGHTVKQYFNAAEDLAIGNEVPRLRSPAAMPGIGASRFTDETRIVMEARLAELEVEGIAYNDARGAVDWETMYDLNRAVIRSQRRGTVAAGDHYAYDTAYDITLNTMDDTGLFAAALEDIIDNADTKRPLAGGISSGTTGVAPYGRGLTRLKEKNQRYLERSGRTSMVDEYRNPNTVGGFSRTIRIFTEKVPQSHIDFRDSVNPYTQFERALTQASRVVVDGQRLIDGTEVGEIMGRFAEYQAAGKFDEMMGLYDDTTARLMNDFDEVSPAEFKELREQYRASNQMWESASEPQRAMGVNNVDGIAVEADVAVHLGDETIVTTRKIHPDDTPETVIGSATSTSQVHTTRVLPRWDLVSRELQKYERRAAAVDGTRRLRSGALDKVENVQRSVGAAGTIAMSIWRPAILLTPKWPMRVGLDEQLRIASQLGTMETLRTLVRSMPDLTRTMAAKSVARKGRSIDIAGDLTHITTRIDDVLEANGIARGTGTDLFPRMQELEAKLGVEAAEKELKKVYSKLLDEQLAESRQYRASVAGVKGLLISTLIAPPAGFVYAGMSFASRRRRIVQAGQQRAALSMGDALQNEGRRMIREAVDNPALAADAEQMIRRGESINKYATKAAIPEGIQDVLTKADQRLADGGLPMLTVGNNRVRGAYGDNVSDSERLHRATSSSNSLGHIYRGANADNARQVEKFQRTDWTRWDVLEAGADHGDRFARMIELYTTKGEFKPFYDILWRNTDDTGVQAQDLANLLGSDEALRRRLGFNRASDDQLLDMAGQLIDEYNAVLPPGYGFDGLRDKAFDGGQPQWSEVDTIIKARAEDWGVSRDEAILRIREEHPGFGRAISPDASSPSPANPRTQLSEFIDKQLESLFDTLGTQVSDNVARSPYYTAKYDAEVTRRIQNHIDDTGNASLTQKTLDTIEADARKGALADTRTLLYDLAEDTRFGELMTNLMPFYNAWGEVISRWGGMAVENPYFVANSYRIYSKPWNAETLGITEVTDEESGSSYLMFRWHNPTQDPDSEGVRTVFDVMSPAVRNLLIPKPMQDPDRSLRFSKDGLASMLQSTTPGFGPLVTIPVREAVLANPTLEETFGFMFPFGHPEGGFIERAIKDSSPTWLKSVDDLLRDSNTNERVVQSMFVDYAVQRQEAGDPIDAGDIVDVNNAIDVANERANEFHVFRVAAGLFSPTSTTALSPYAPLIKIARELQQEHGTLEGNQMFLAEYGEDLFALSARMTQLNDGVAAAIESEELYADHQELVQGHPSIGGWVTESLGGTDEQFAFSQAAYRRQRNMEISPSDDRNRRERKTPTETVAGPARELGWAAYTRLSDAVRTEQAKAQAAGLPFSLNANSMAGLKQFKSEQMLLLRDKYPEWAEQLDDFGRSSRGMKDVVDGFMAGLRNPEILARPSSVHVVEYFQLRQAVQDELVRLKSVGLSDNLDANSNEGLRLYFEEQKAELGDRPEFSALYDRYFERDTLQRPTFADDGAFKLEFV